MSAVPLQMQLRWLSLRRQNQRRLGIDVAAHEDISNAANVLRRHHRCESTALPVVVVGAADLQVGPGRISKRRPVGRDVFIPEGQVRRAREPGG